MRHLALALVALLIAMPVGSPLAAYGATSAPANDVAETIAAAPRLDGTTVTLEGEAIGERLRAESGYAWVNLLDGDTAIGVVMRTDDASRIAQYGEWSRTGDRVRVTGVLSEACPAHGGDLDVHATSVEIVSAGSAIPHPVHVWKAVVGAGGLGLAAWLFRSYGRSRYREND